MNNAGTIFAISPDYLDVLNKESAKYDFALQGYGSFQKACKCLIKTNVEDILGYVFLSYELPKDLTFFREFLDKCNLCGGDKKFLIATLNQARITQLDYSSYKNLKFGIVKINEVVTDVVINRDIFGSILLANFEPYVLTEKVEQKSINGNVPILTYEPLLSKDVLDCVDKIQLHSSLEETIRYDEILYRFKLAKSPLALLREFYIKSFYPIEQDKSSLECILNNCTPKEYGIYKALIEMVSSEHVVQGGE